MKKRNVLALALAAGLVLGGANTAFAEGWEGNYQDNWEAASKEQDEKLAAEKKAKLEEELANDWKDPNKTDWDLASEEQDKKIAEEKAKELANEWKGYEDPYKKGWEDASKEQDARNLANEWKGYDDPYKKGWEDASKEQDENLANKDNEKPAEGDKKQEENKLAAAKEKAIEELKAAGITSDFFINQIRKAKTIEGVEALKADLLKSHTDSNKKEEKPGKEDKENGTYKPGYATREEAEEAAKEALKNIKTKDSYTIFVDADGRYGYYLWNSKDEKEAEKAAKIKEASKENEKAKEGKASTPAAKSSNPNAAPKTGVAGMSAVAGLAAVSVAGIIATRKKED